MPSASGRQHFQDQMRALELSALGAVEMVVAQLERVTQAAEPLDLALAALVIADDDRVDGRYLEVHQGVLSLLALQAPVAGDLRAVAGVLHLINAVERIGDQCVNIAKMLPIPDHHPPSDHPVSIALNEMGLAVRDELVTAQRAFAERDVKLAETVVERDRAIDRRNVEIFRLAVDAGAEPRLREWAMTATLIARAFERIGGNACDIAEQTIFVATGERPEPWAPARRGATA